MSDQQLTERKPKWKRIYIATAFVAAVGLGSTTITQIERLQVPFPKTAAEVNQPVNGVEMPLAYAKAVGQMA